MKPTFLSTSFSAVMALTLVLAPTSWAQQPAPPVPEPAPAQKPPAPAEGKVVPKINYDDKELPPNTPSYAPVVERVAPSVVTISTSKLVRPGDRDENSMKNNPLFNDPNLRRYFGIPDGDDDQQAPQPPRRNRNNRNRGADQAPGGSPEKGGRPQALGLGSGVIVSPDGYIITNNHVVEGADEISVTLGNSSHEYKAKKIGVDPGSDIAVIKIEGKDFPAITFTDSDKLRAGDIVLAVGNPFGLTQSATMGVVSAVGRGNMGIVDYENFIQTDASINMGNSGGALVDIQGRLVGINTAIFSRTGGNQGIGFAVPANLARSVMESLLKSGKVQRGFLGVSLQPLTEDLVKAFALTTDTGALIAEVQPKSPAEKAGVQSGDVVVSVDGKPVKSPRELQLLIGGLSPTSTVELKLVREGKEQVVKVALGERPGKGLVASNEPAQAEDPDVLDGVTVADLDENARKASNVPEHVKGVVIAEIDPESASAAAGLQKGDVILELNRTPVTSAKQAVELSEKVKKDQKVVLRVFSKGSTRYVVIEDK